MHNGRQRHQGEITQRDFQSARCQPKLGRRATKRLKAGTVGCCVTKLPDPRQAYLAAEMTTDHGETGCATIHLVDLHDEVDLASAPSAFAEKSALIRKRFSFVFRVSRPLLAIQLYFVVNPRFSRQKFRSEIEWNTSFRFCLVKCKSLAQHFIKFRKPVPQSMHRPGFEGEQLTIGNCFYGCRAG